MGSRRLQIQGATCGLRHPQTPTHVAATGTLGDYRTVAGHVERRSRSALPWSRPVLCQKGRFVADSGDLNENDKTTPPQSVEATPEGVPDGSAEQAASPPVSGADALSYDASAITVLEGL